MTDNISDSKIDGEREEKNEGASEVGSENGKKSLLLPRTVCSTLTQGKRGEKRRGVSSSLLYGMSSAEVLLMRTQTGF